VSGIPVISLQFILDAIENLTIISALILIYYFLPSDRLSRSKRTYPLRIGILFGCIAAISTPILWGGANAPVIGFNVALVPLAALIGGPVASAVVAAALMLASSLSAGTISRIDSLTVLCMVLLGSLFWYKSSGKWLSPSSPARLVLLGSGVAIIEICSFLIHSVLRGSGAPVPGFSQLAAVLPFAILSFLSTIFLGSLIGFINRKKEVELSLALTNRKLNLALDGAKAKNWELDLATGELQQSGRIAAFAGYSPDETPHTMKELDAMTHPDDLPKKLQDLQHYLDDKTGTFENLSRVKDKARNWRWYLSRGNAIEWDASGRPTRIIGVVIDVTVQKEAEEELRAAYQQITAAEEELREKYDELARSEQRIRESEEKYRAVVTLASDGILINQDGLIRFINPKGAELHGSTREDLLNVPFIGFVHQREREKVEALYRGWMNGGQSSPVYETTIVKRNGEPVDIEVNVARITFEGKTADLVFMRDITERKRSQKALDHAKKKLQMLNYVTFTDIQNQVFTLRGYQQLAGAAVGEAGNRARMLMEKQHEILMRIANSLKFAQTYQDLGLKPASWQNVNRVFLMAISHLDFQKTGHTVTTGGLEIFADPMLERVFQILADNTLVHSRTGTQVTLGYVQEPDESLVLIYSDNGIGIPDADKSRMFLPGIQEKKSMGLFLAREILETTEIGIRETGTPGTGVRFEMRVPKGAYRFRNNH